MRKNRMRKVRNLLAITVVMALTLTISAVTVYGAGANSSPTKAQITDYLKQNNISLNTPVEFAETPVKYSATAGNVGNMSTASKNSALATLNAVRYICGLNPVTLDITQGSKAQAGAFVNWSIDDLTHHPDTDGTKPEYMPNQVWQDGITGAGNSNIAYGRDNLNSTIVFGWMADSGASNLKSVGHRRWCLNPAMGKTGFGATTGSSYSDKYYAMWSFDASASGSQKNVIWPAQRTPVEFFSGNIPWSLSTGDTSIRDISNVSVTLTRRSSSPSGEGTWSFSTQKTYTETSTGEYFTVQLNGANGGSYAGARGPYVVFRPANITYKPGDIFDITITGLGSSTISYTVEFISGFPVESVAFEETEYTMMSSRTITPKVLPEEAQGYEFTFESSDESVATVSNTGKVTLVGNGDATITAKVDGKYTASGHPITASYTLHVPKDINDCDITLTEDYYYTGEKVRPEAVIRDGDKVLKEGEDYEFEVPDNVVAPKYSGQAYMGYLIRIKGKGEYGGSKSKSIWIVRQKLANCQVILTPSEAEYTGSTQVPEIMVKNGNLELEEGVDYTVSSNSGGTNKGTYNVRVTAASGSELYSGSKTETFTIKEKTITSDMVTVQSPYTYTGSGIEASVVVKNGSLTMTKGTDYTLEYSNNINAGVAAVKVTGKGNYKGEVTKEFQIQPKQLTGSMVELSESTFEYNGTNQIPDVTVRDGGTISSDYYTVDPVTAINKGDYSIKVTGKNNYSGVVSKSFNITARPLDKTQIQVEGAEATYNGTHQSPTSISLSDNGRTLALLTDYKITENTGGTNAGDYNIVIEGGTNGNYSGRKTATFKIVPASVNGKMVTVDPASYQYDGKEKTPEVSLVVDDRVLVRNEDFTISYSNNKNAGNAGVTVTGKGNYKDSATGSFDIEPYDISGEKVSVSDMASVVYNGAAQTPEPQVVFDGVTLKKGTDYSLSYDDNKNVGQATVTITGKGNFSGSRNTQFTIGPKDLEAKDISVDSIADQEYKEGNSCEPAITVRDGSVSLAKGTDYKVEYSDNDKEGTAIATITGIGNYSGSIEKSFNIVDTVKLAAKNALSEKIKELESLDTSGYSEEDRAKVASAIAAAKELLEQDPKEVDASAYENALNEVNEAKDTADQNKANAGGGQNQTGGTDPGNDPVSGNDQGSGSTPGNGGSPQSGNNYSPGADPKQKGSDGTALGEGASAAAAEKAITGMKNDNDPAGSKHGLLQLKSTKQGNSNIQLNWKKVKKAKKYVIYGNACGKKNKMKKLKTLSKNSFNMKKLAGKKLKKGTYHKFLVVALDRNNNVVSSSKVIHVATKGGKVGNHKSITVKAKVDAKGKAIKKLKPLSKTQIKKGKKVTLKATANPANKKLKVKKHVAIRYESANPKIAKVNKKGVVTGVKKGKTKIFVYAQNGVTKAVTITVK